jgi:tetratricopeptide (TPR) repeat protein
MTTDLSTKITGLMYREMSDLGPLIVKKKCKDVGLDPENIRTEDLILVSKAISEAMASFGADKAKRIYHEISKLHDLEKMVNKEENLAKKVEGFLSLGDSARLSGEHEKAIEFYNRVLALKDSPEGKPHAPKANCMIGTSLILKNEPKNALAHFNKALEAGDALGEDILAMAHRGIGYSHWRVGDFDITKANYELALKHATNFGNKELIGTIKIDMGMLLENMGKYEESLASYREAIEKLTGTGNYYNLARAHNNSGEIYKHYEQWSQAIACYDKCLVVSKAGRNEVMMGYAMGNSAECYAKMGELNKARDLAAKTMEIFKKRNDFYMIAGVHLTNGIIHMKQRDKFRMDESFSEAVKMLKRLNYPYEVGTHTFEYARALKTLGFRYEARERFEESLEIFRKLGSDKYVKAVEQELTTLEKKVK